MVECQLPKLKVGGSNPLSRSNKNKDLADMVRSFFIDITTSCIHLKISGIGKFIIVHKKHDRLGRNPQTGESLTITACKILTFKPSILLKQEINGE